MKHENIITFIDAKAIDNKIYLIMKYCDQGNLDNLLAKKKFLEESEVMNYFK